MELADIRQGSLRTRVQLLIESVREPVSAAEIVAHPLIAGSDVAAVRRHLHALFRDGRAAIISADDGDRWIAYPRPRRPK